MCVYVYFCPSKQRLFFVHPIVICDQLGYPAHWASLVPRPEGIIRFGNAEDKLMLISMHMHTPTHTDTQACVHTVHFGLCKSVSHSSFEMYRKRMAERFCRDKHRVQTEDVQNLWNLTRCKGICRKCAVFRQIILAVFFFLTFQKSSFSGLKI